MSTQQGAPNKHLIKCHRCGEWYSDTYRKCPFCDDVPKIHTPSTDNPDDRPPFPVIEPVRIVGYALGLILIVAAIYIVITMLSPLFGGKEPASSGAESSVDVSSSVSVPDVSVSTPDVSVPDVSVPDPDPSVVTPVVKTTALTLSTTDFTLKADETYKVALTVTPSNSDEAVVWTSSDTSIATVAADGSITNVNTGSAQKVVTVTATSGSVSVQCTVRCKPGSSGTATPPAPAAPTTPTTPTTPATPSTTPVAAGTTGVINSDGVRIRTAPVTGEVQDTGYINSEITILEKTSDGWYKIRYNIGGGKTKDGYISAQFVTVK